MQSIHENVGECTLEDERHTSPKPVADQEPSENFLVGKQMFLSELAIQYI